MTFSYSDECRTKKLSVCEKNVAAYIMYFKGLADLVHYY